MDIESYLQLKPIKGKSFTQEDLLRYGLGSTIDRPPEVKLSVADQRRKNILDEQLKSGQPLWCPEEDDESIQRDS